MQICSQIFLKKQGTTQGSDARKAQSIQVSQRYWKNLVFLVKNYRLYVKNFRQSFSFKHFVAQWRTFSSDSLVVRKISHEKFDT